MTKRELIDILESDDSPDETEVTIKTDKNTDEETVVDWAIGRNDNGKTTITLYNY